MAASRIVSLVAATILALACGTNYAYSAWAPEFAEKLRLSSTQSNLIGAFGNLGMYGSGIPVGLLVDHKGVKPGVFLGAFLMGIGYFFQYKAFNDGPQSISVGWLCFFALITGVGGSAAIASAVKSSAINWPEHRGTATAFPLAALGLSAFFFSMISAVAFPDDTSKYLLLLTALTFSINFVAGFFLNAKEASNDLHALQFDSSGRSTSASSTQLRRIRADKMRASSTMNPTQGPFYSKDDSDDDEFADESVLSRKTLLAKTRRDSNAVSSSKQRQTLSQSGDSVDVRALQMLCHFKFWLLFLILGLLAGLGLMTINNVGNNTRALWHHYDDTATAEFIQERQLMHVEILSIMSCIGRLLSGIGSDVFVRNFHVSRLWCLALSSIIFMSAQLAGYHIDNPNALGIVSGLNGLAYGFLFGCFPAITCESFGIKALSQNWGFMSLAPILSGNFFNLIYGSIYDQHSVIAKDGTRNCADGLNCFRTAYGVTSVAAGLAFVIALISVRWDSSQKDQRRGGSRSRYLAA